MRKDRLTFKRITTIALTVLSITTGEVFAAGESNTKPTLPPQLEELAARLRVALQERDARHNDGIFSDNEYDSDNESVVKSLMLRSEG